MLVQCWASVADSGPTLNQHFVNVLCLQVGGELSHYFQGRIQDLK